MNQNKALKNTEWLANRLNISVSTVERLRNQEPSKIPPHIMIGNVIRYNGDFVEWWLLQQTTPEIPSFDIWSKQNEKI